MFLTKRGKIAAYLKTASPPLFMDCWNSGMQGRCGGVWNR